MGQVLKFADNSLKKDKEIIFAAFKTDPYALKYVDETLKKVASDNHIAATVNRADHRLAQTPQIFRYGLLKKAMQFAFDNALMPTDEAQAVEHHGEKVKIIEGFAGNIKITESLDLKLAEMILSLRGVSCV